MVMEHNEFAAFKQRLELLPHARVQLRGRIVPTFRLCLAAGLTLGVALALALTAYRGLDLVVMAVVAASALFSFFALAMLTKIVTGTENMVHFHCVLAAMFAAAIIAWLLRQPILPYLDATILGIGMLTVCGRIGCLMAGCCHGRPHAWGVCYRDEHAAIGFPEYLVGVRLFPIQLVESLCALAIVSGGIALIISGAVPGVALAWYLILYGVARFCIEFARGDLERPYRLNLSEAQWTALGLSGLLISAEWLGLVPFQLWHSIVMVGLGAAAFVVVIRGRIPSRDGYSLEQLSQLHELAKAVHTASRRAEHIVSPQENGQRNPIQVAQTHLGIRISTSHMTLPNGEITQYTFSSRDGTLTRHTAEQLATFVRQPGHRLETSTLIESQRGIFHLVMYPMIQQNKG